MTTAEIQTELAYRRAERIAILSAGERVEPWMEDMAWREADAWLDWFEMVREVGN